VFRPQNVAIIEPGSHEGADHNRITGSVCHMEFLGSVIRYGVDIGNDVVLIDHPHKQGESTIALSSKVDLLVDRDGIQVVA
jgi:iron(III) transport system ATP-binding protein